MSIGGDQAARKWAVTVGALVEPVPHTDPTSLDLLLPAPLRKHEGAPAFLQRVASLCEFHAPTCEELKAGTEEQKRRSILALAAAASRMRSAASALTVLEKRQDVFDALDADYRYLAIRANESPLMSDQGRPVVARLPSGVPSTLEGLASRLDDLLEAIRLTCEHTAKRIKPTTVVRKDREEVFAAGVALAHQEAFGELPPEGGWWRCFIEEVGKRMGWNIGHRIAAAAVRRAQRQLTPPSG